MKYDRRQRMRISGAILDHGLVARFQGFLPVRALLASRCQEVSDEPGVYLLIRISRAEPSFLRKNPSGRFKERDPTLSLKRLRTKWVPKSQVLYIGKAGWRRDGSTFRRQTLRRRLRQYLDHGRGLPVAHWGGRLVWQLADAGNLLVCWLPTPDEEPRAVERRLIAAFKKEHAALPFANWRG